VIAKKNAYSQSVDRIILQKERREDVILDMVGHRVQYAELSALPSPSLFSNHSQNLLGGQIVKILVKKSKAQSSGRSNSQSNGQKTKIFCSTGGPE